MEYFSEPFDINLLKNHILKDPIIDWFNIISTRNKTYQKDKVSYYQEFILKESKEVFYNKDFHNKLDSNPHLLGCKNGVVDFKNKTFRKGRPDDYISLSTNIVYNKLDKKTMSTQNNQMIGGSPCMRRPLRSYTTLGLIFEFVSWSVCHKFG